MNIEENITHRRLDSLDALRGFDMFWITGGQKLVFALATTSGWPIFIWMNNQMHHVPWHGFAFYDMIFPLFLFLAGVSMPFSVAHGKARGDSRKKLYQKAFKRMILLVFLGLIYNRVLELDLDNIRFGSVLGRIGIAWFFAFLIYMNFSIRGQLLFFMGLVVSYYIMMIYVPVPGYGAGVLSPEGNLAGYIDRLFLPGIFYMESMEPEGILSTIPAIATALLGVFTGKFLKEYSNIKTIHKISWLVLSGVILIILGKLWDSTFPINKYLWTSSFVLYAGGWSILLLTLFYLLIDVWKFKKWAFFFVVIGLNSITIYMVQHKIIDFHNMRDFIFSGLIEHSPDFIVPYLSGLGYIFCVWIFLYFLYRNRIFLKV